jgi:hypothetical protein
VSAIQNDVIHVNIDVSVERVSVLKPSETAGFKGRAVDIKQEITNSIRCDQLFFELVSQKKEI